VHQPSHADGLGAQHPELEDFFFAEVAEESTLERTMMRTTRGSGAPARSAEATSPRPSGSRLLSSTNAQRLRQVGAGRAPSTTLHFYLSYLE
jgi:hypothetical protein